MAPELVIVSDPGVYLDQIRSIWHGTNRKLVAARTLQCNSHGLGENSGPEAVVVSLLIFRCFYLVTGEGGIRTLGTLLGYGALAKRCFRPLSHLTKIILRRQYGSIEQRLLDLPERGREYGG
jgi:hypothetical protein